MKKILAALFAAAAAFANAQDRAADRFDAGRADAAAASAQTARDFERAASLYAALARENGADVRILENLGACRLLSGDVSGAVEAYDAAMRRAGETPASRRGLAAAFARLQDDPAAKPPFARRVFAPHWTVPLADRILAAAVSWAALWIIATAARVCRRCGARRAAAAARAAAWAAAAAFAVCTASCALSALDERRFSCSPAMEAVSR